VTGVDAAVFYIVALWGMRWLHIVPDPEGFVKTWTENHAVWTLTATVSPKRSHIDETVLWGKLVSYLCEENSILGSKLLAFDLHYSADRRKITISVTR